VDDKPASGESRREEIEQPLAAIRTRMDELDRSRIGAWSAAAARLRDRDPMPGDRASFFFQPIELLGIALGAAAIADSETTPSRAGRRSRIDLLLKREQIIIETKRPVMASTSAKSPRNWPSTRSCTAPTRTAAHLCSSSMTPAAASSNPTALEADLTDLTSPIPTLVIVTPLV
jgi:hypothetical protein